MLGGGGGVAERRKDGGRMAIEFLRRAGTNDHVEKALLSNKVSKVKVSSQRTFFLQAPIGDTDISTSLVADAHQHNN